MVVVVVVVVFLVVVMLLWQYPRGRREGVTVSRSSSWHTWVVSLAKQGESPVSGGGEGEVVGGGGEVVVVVPGGGDGLGGGGDGLGEAAVPLATHVAVSVMVPLTHFVVPLDA